MSSFVRPNGRKWTSVVNFLAFFTPISRGSLVAEVENAGAPPHVGWVPETAARQVPATNPSVIRQTKRLLDANTPFSNKVRLFGQDESEVHK
jgi:hypothetical protein